ncbi:MAG: TetR family transcriptional regulator [Actinomycetota bacterium]
MGEPGSRKRGAYKSSEQVRARLLEAAMTEFATHGFEGASTRAIARRAGAHQPQINYHFESKEALWYAVMDAFMEEIDEFMPDPGTSIREGVEEMIRGFVRFSAARPELNRIMSSEAAEPSDRLTWLIDTHIRPRYVLYRAAWETLQADGVGDHVPIDLVWHLMVGAASLIHSNAAETEALVGITPSDPETIEAHADAMVRLFLG